MTVDVAVGHQRAAVCTTPVHDRHRIIETNDNEVNISYECMCRRTILEFIPFSNCNFVHSYRNLLTANAATTSEPVSKMMTLGIAEAAPA